MLDKVIVASGSGGGEKGYNPFEGVIPDFGPFQGLFESKIDTLLGVVWAGAFCVAGVFLIISFAKLAKSKDRPGGMDDGRSGAMWSGGSIILLTCVGVIFGLLVR